MMMKYRESKLYFYIIKKSLKMELSDWMLSKKALFTKSLQFYQRDHLEVGNLFEWPIGQTREMLILDGNFEEYKIWD
jgi:hypothetical protein